MAPGAGLAPYQESAFTQLSEPNNDQEGSWEVVSLPASDNSQWSCEESELDIAANSAHDIFGSLELVAQEGYVRNDAQTLYDSRVHIENGSTAHSQGDSHLQIRVTRTIEVSTAAGPAAGDKWPYVVTVSSSGHLRPERYMLLQLSNVNCIDALKTLNVSTGKENGVLHIEELSYGSWELVVLKSYCRMFQDMLYETFANPGVNLNYDPLEPIAACVKLLGYSAARNLSRHLFVQRAERIIKDGSPAAAYFAYRLDGPEAGLRTDHDQLSDDANNDATLDEVMKGKEIVAVSRSYGIWMFKIKFHGSTLSPEYYDGIQICGLPASAFVALCIGTEGNNYFVEWKPQWQDEIPNELKSGPLNTLLCKLATIAAPTDNLLWRAEASICTINSNGPSYHVCTEQDCSECEHAIRSLSNEPHFQSVALRKVPGCTYHPVAETDDDGESKRKNAVGFLANVLQASQEQYSGNLQEIAKAVLNLAYYENPFSQLFPAEDDGSSTQFLD